jgi:hypothetical protein
MVHSRHNQAGRNPVAASHNRMMAFALCMILSAQSVTACPFCETATAEEVRRTIFNDHFGYHLAASLAPFPVMMAFVAVMYFRRSNR